MPVAYFVDTSEASLVKLCQNIEPPEGVGTAGGSIHPSTHPGEASMTIIKCHVPPAQKSRNHLGSL